METQTTTNLRANRYGLDFNVYDINDTSRQTSLMQISFVNISSIELSSDRTWASGGQEHSNKVGFNDPIQGTLTLSTQVFTTQLLHLLVGNPLNSQLQTIEFKNNKYKTPKYYILQGQTVWQDANGVIHDEETIFYKVSPRTAYNIQYTAEGDPASMDIIFDLFEDEIGRVIKIKRGNDSTLDEPTISISGDVITITDIDEDAEYLAVYADGQQIAIIRNE